MAGKCDDCLHRPVCKSADSCDGQVPGCRHFEPRVVAERRPLQSVLAALIGGLLGWGFGEVLFSLFMK